MPSKIVTTTELGGAVLDGPNQYLYVLRSGDLRSSGYTVLSSGGTGPDPTTIVNHGAIVSLSESFGYSAIRFSAGYGTLQNAGFISASGDGVRLASGAAATITNSGTIFGAHSGVSVDTSDTLVTITNTGLIGGFFGIDTFSGISLVNTGTISGEQTGVQSWGGQIWLNNAGIISARANGNAVTGAELDDTVLNYGTLLGGVWLGGESDLYDGRAGRVTGDVHGGAGQDTLLGGIGAETLRGGDGDDEIRGGGGDDWIDGGEGADLLDGGEGFDIVSFATIALPVLVDLQTSALNLGEAAEDALLNFEGVLGGAGADTLRGSATGNELRGGFGNDLLDGRAGADTLRGGQGDDLMLVDNAGDRVIERPAEGADTVVASVSYQLMAGAEVEFLVTPDAAALTALNFIGSNTANTLVGNAGANRLTGRAGADLLRGEDGLDTLFGGSEADTLLGGASNDQLFGERGEDSLGGGEGNDRLAGGEDNDVLTGGAGQDQFIFDTVSSYNFMPFGPLNLDRITDFNPVDDTIRISLAAFPELGVAGALQASAFLKVAGGGATLASHRIIYDPTTGIIWYDANGSELSLPVQMALLENMPANVTAGDFVIIA